MPNPAEGPEPAERAPLSERICEAVCVTLALWTLCSQVVVALGGSLSALIALFASVSIGVGAFFVDRRRRGFAPEPDPELPAPAPRTRALRIARWVGLGLGVAATLAVARVADAVFMWWAMLALLLAAATGFLFLEPPMFEAPRRGGRREALLWGLAALCVVYALVVHRPDGDDAFYVNVAVAAVDQPELPLLHADTMLGRGDLPLYHPIYRVQSFELLNAAIARLSGLSVLRVFHNVSAALGALLVPLALAVLWRLLLPRLWLEAAFVHLLLLLAIGETHRWYGNFALVRIWQGKALYLTAILPLIHAYAMRFAARPTARRFALLVAVQIASVGLTANAIWSGPAGALVAMAAVLRPNARDLRRLALGATATLYPLVAGALHRTAMVGRTRLSETFEPGDRLADAFARTFGDGNLQIAVIAAILLAWAVSPRGLAQRFAIAAPLAVMLVFFDPYADEFVRRFLTGPSYWRSTWALPAPVLLTLLLVAPLHLEGSTWRRRAGRAIAAAATLAFLVLVPSYPTWSAANGARIGWPGLKVAPDALRWARLASAAAPGQRVLAPPMIGDVMPMLHDRAYPLLVRFYLRHQREDLGAMAYRDRIVMTWFAEGEERHPQADAIFARGLDLYDVRAVVLRVTELAGRSRQILRQNGYRRRIQGRRFEIWARDEDRRLAP